jgi:hypothetical protein
MAETLQFSRQLAALDANKKPIKATHLDQTEVRAGDDVTVYREKKPDDKFWYWGHGGQNRQSGNTAHKYADIVCSGNGSGTSGDPVEGDVYVAITDSDGRVLAERHVGDISTLADAADDARTERPVMPALAPYLTQGRYIEVLINADADSDGMEIDPSASSARLWYSEV